MLPPRILAFGLFLLSVPACQCFVPVADDLADAGAADASVDAGADAGVDAGVVDGGECATAADCAGMPWASRWCLFGTPAGFSCVERRCVSECVADAGRACSYDESAECLTCSDGASTCEADTCPTDAFTATISSVECRPGVAPPFGAMTTLSFVPVRGASCMLSVSTPGAGLGQVLREPRGVRHAWFIRELGGWCVGETLPTGAVRSMVACPLCTFGVEGF
ncbi:MAG: hypothetical protein ACOZQL_37820 [Myxococcota bacterium]